MLLCATPFIRMHAPARPAVRMCTMELAEPMSMRVKALKEELDSRGVAWRGVAFEKEELARLLEDARKNPTPQPPSPSPSAPPTSPPPPSAAASANTDEVGDDEMMRKEISKMKISEIKQGLAEAQPRSPRKVRVC